MARHTHQAGTTRTYHTGDTVHLPDGRTVTVNGGETVIKSRASGETTVDPTKNNTITRR